MTDTSQPSSECDKNQEEGQIEKSQFISESDENQQEGRKIETNQPSSEYDENLEEGELQPSDFTVVDEVGESEDTETGENDTFQKEDEKPSKNRKVSSESKSSKHKDKDNKSRSKERDYEKRKESRDKKHDKKRTSSDEIKHHKSPKGKHHGKDDQPRKSSSERSRHRSDRTRSRSRHRHSDKSTSKTPLKGSASKSPLKDRNRHKSSEDRRSRHGSSSLAERVAEACVGKAENEKSRRDRIGITVKRERDWDRGKRRSTDIRDRRRSSELLLGPDIRDRRRSSELLLGPPVNKIKRERREEDDNLGISSFLKEVRETSKEEKPSLTLDDLGTILKGQNPIGWVNLNARKWNYYPQFTEMGALKPARFGQGQIFQCSLKVKDYVTNGTGRSKKEAKQECYKAMVLLLAAPKKPKPTVPNISEAETSGATEIKQEPGVNPSPEENVPAIPSLLSLPPVPAPPARPQPWFYSQEILKATSCALFGHPISLLMEKQMKMHLPPPEFRCEKQSSFNIYSWHGFKPDFIFSCAILLNRGDPRVYFGRGATKKEGKFQAALAVFADTMGIADQMQPAASLASTSDNSSIAASSATSSTLGSASTSSLAASPVVCSTSSLPNSSATTSSIVKNSDPLYPRVMGMTAFVPASDQEMAQVTHPVKEDPGELSKAKSPVSNMKVPELRQELEKRNLVSRGTRAMLTARLEEALWQEEVTQLRSTLEQKGLSTKGTKDELASRLEEALMTELTETLKKRNLSTEGTKEELSQRLEEAIKNEECEVKMDTDAEARTSTTELAMQLEDGDIGDGIEEAEDIPVLKEKIEEKEEDRLKRELELKEKLKASVREKKEAKALHTKDEIETTKAALNKIESSMELTDEEKSLIAKKLKAGLRKSRKSSDSILEDLFHDLEKKLVPKKTKKRKRDRSKSPKHGAKKKSRKGKDENEAGSSVVEDHKIKRKAKKEKKDKKRKSSERSSKKKEKGSNSESDCKDMALEDFVVVDAVGEDDEIDENAESNVTEDKLSEEHVGATSDIPEKILGTNDDDEDDSTPVKIDLTSFKFSKTITNSPSSSQSTFGLKPEGITNSPSSSKSSFGLNPEEYRQKYFGLVGFPIASSSNCGDTNTSEFGINDNSEKQQSSNTSLDCGTEVKVETGKVSQKKLWPKFSFEKDPEVKTDESIGEGETKENLIENLSELLKNKNALFGSANDNIKKIDPSKSIAPFSSEKMVKHEKISESENNPSEVNKEKNESVAINEKKEKPEKSETSVDFASFSFAKTVKDEKKDKPEKSETRVDLATFSFSKTVKDEKDDTVNNPSFASFSFAKTVKDDKKEDPENTSGFAAFSFVKPDDVKTEKIEKESRPEYIENSEADSKGIINEALKLTEGEADLKSEETGNPLASFRFIKTSIKNETLDDLGTKTVANCKDSSSQSNDPKTSDSKYYANLFNFNIPKAKTLFRSIQATGSIFDQNLLDLGMKVEVNDQDEREIQIKKQVI